MAGQVFGSVIAGLVAIDGAHAGKLVVPHSADLYAELYAIEQLCPTMKIDLEVVAKTASLDFVDPDTLQSALAEGRRRSPIAVSRLAGLSAAQVCEYGHMRYSKYLTDR